MKEFKGLVLCEFRSERVDVHVWADLAGGALTVAGQDLGPQVETFWGDDDYEYWYSFDRENTARLLAALGGEDDPAQAFLREFSGLDGCRALRNLCEKNGIRYKFFSY
ncbi:MAG: hypothetical protein IJH91_00120 [Mogibacterium sp.]|nr:hypothetical protein [Mogibacterium sp.]